MATSTLLIYYLVFLITLWLGYYLMARNLRKPILLLTGYGLGFYAAAIMLEVLQTSAPPEINRWLTFIPNIFIYLPALLWTGTLIQLVPDETPQKNSFFRLWMWVVLPLTFLVILATGLYGFSPILLTIIVLLPLAGAYLFLLLKRPRGEKYPLALPLIATIFFGLAVGLTLPVTWLPRWLVIISIGLDLMLLGIGIAIFDAFDEGQRLWADMIRSLMSAVFLGLLFGIQLALVIALETQLTFGMIVLTFSLLATITFLATFSTHLRNWLNRFIRPHQPEQTNFRAAARALDQLDSEMDFSQMDEKTFQRLTRKAISHLGDLPRLTTSPFTYLPLVTKRLEARNTRTDTLSRANELKSLLTESIYKLMPDSKAEFGTTDAWRFFNALYYPYILGIKPYRRTQSTTTLSETERQALEWFRVEVPERTLHNWQTAAAKLIARDLREQIRS